MNITPKLAGLALSALLVQPLAISVWAQRPGGGARAGGGGGAGGRTAGFRSPGAGSAASPGPAMSRPGGGGSELSRPGGGVPGGMQRPGANARGAAQRPSAGQPGGIQRPGAGGPGGLQRPGAGQPGEIQRPGSGAPGGLERPGAAGQPRPSSGALQDFLGGGGAGPSATNRLPDGFPRPGAGGTLNQRPGASPGDRTNIGNRTNIGGQTNIGNGNRTDIGLRRNNTNINVGNVNIGNQVSFQNNRQAWVDQRQSWGNNVRAGIGGRYNNVFNSSFYRGGFARGGYNYYRGWMNRGPYFAWSPFTWAAFGSFLGGAWASASPIYFAYGQGGNVYYENNVVYMNGQPAGTPEQYFQQTQALAAAAPPADQLNAQEQDWLPLGVFAVTSEDTSDSQNVIQLAVNKQGVIAGTLYNEATQVSRPIQGTADVKTQRAVMMFADGKDTDRVLETGINNLTQDEAPALLHFGANQSQPVLLVRLKQPEGAAPGQ
jgi:hypothetical protein